MKSEDSPLAPAQAKFSELGLPFPYVPEELAAQVRPLDEWSWGTRPALRGLYDLPAYLEEVGTRPLDDYLLLGQDGHGMQSYAIHYYVVRGALALFVQKAWGGAYTDSAGQARALAQTFAAAEQILRQAQGAAQRGAFAPGERLIVVDSDRIGARWARLARVQPERIRFITSTEWHEDASALHAVLGQLSALGGESGED